MVQNLSGVNLKLYLIPQWKANLKWLQGHILDNHSQTPFWLKRGFSLQGIWKNSYVLVSLCSFSSCFFFFLSAMLSGLVFLVHLSSAVVAWNSRVVLLSCAMTMNADSDCDSACVRQLVNFELRVPFLRCGFEQSACAGDALNYGILIRYLMLCNA